jgi:hypothetical protein
MATSLNVSSAYNGALAGEIFVEAFKKSDTISKNAITLIPNVIGTGHLPRLSYSSGLQAYSCGWNPTGDVDYTDKEVATKKFMINHELCKDEFHSTFQAQAAGLFSAKAEIPSSIQEAILQAIVDNLRAIVDTQIWQGNGTGNQFTGILPQLVADADVIDVTITAVTSANVVAQIELAYNAIPAEIEDDEDLVIVVSKNVAKAYKQAQASMGLNTTVGQKEMDYLGTRMESLGGLPANSILVYRVKNLGFLTGLESDLNSVQIKDMDDSDLSGNIRTKVVFNAGVGYSFGAEIVYARPA